MIFEPSCNLSKPVRDTTSPGFKQAYAQFTQGGWQGVIHPTEYGGQGFPKLIATPCAEMLHAASLSFALCPMLTDGAIEALLVAGSDELKRKYVGKLISGEWTGTMNLTEPQAGSDLAAVRTRAEPQGDGSYKVFGTKIFITWGEHDMAENIVHLVLARVQGAPEGVKGISLFVVPKFLVNANGTLGARNDVQCVSIEHKMGIKASPTAVLQSLPAALRELLIGILEPGCRRDHAVFPGSRVLVPLPVQRREHTLVELRALFEYGLRRVKTGVLETGDQRDRVDVRQVLEVEQHVFQRGGIAHYLFLGPKRLGTEHKEKPLVIS